MFSFALWLLYPPGTQRQNPVATVGLDAGEGRKVCGTVGIRTKQPAECKSLMRRSVCMSTAGDGSTSGHPGTVLLRFF